MTLHIRSTGMAAVVISFAFAMSLVTSGCATSSKTRYVNHSVNRPTTKVKLGSAKKSEEKLDKVREPASKVAQALLK